jgi:hypothetical protein
MTISQWNDIPSDQSEHSHFWDNSNQFESQQFSTNISFTKRYNDLLFLIFFWINFFLIVSFLIYTIITRNKIDNEKKRNNFDSKEFNMIGDCNICNINNFLSILCLVFSRFLHYFWFYFFRFHYVRNLFRLFI